MVIKYEDITLRAIEEEDLELLREMMNDPEIEKMTGSGGLPVSKKDQKKWYDNLTNKDVRLVIETDDHGAIGVVMLTDIDYRNSIAQFHIKLATSKNIRGKGYGTKATYALIRYGLLEMNLHLIYSHIIEYNKPSQRVHEKCGFKKDGTLRERAYKNGQYYDVVVWSITKEDLHD